jgi:hypothetical protein
VARILLSDILTARDEWNAAEERKVAGSEEAVAKRLVQIDELVKLGLSEETAQAMITPEALYVAVPFRIPAGLEAHLSESYHFPESLVTRVITQTGV